MKLRQTSGIFPWLCTWLVVTVLLPAHADNQDFKAEVDDYITHLPPAMRTLDYVNALHDLASDDLAVVLKVVKKFGETKDNRSLEMALLHPNTTVQIEAARQLQVVGNDHDIPLLLAAIKEAKNVPAGSKNETAAKALKSSLLIALARIEGLDLQEGVVIDDTLEKHIIENAYKPQ